MSIFSAVTNVPAATMAGALIGTFLGLIPILKDSAERHWKKEFRRQLAAALINKSISYDDLLHVAERWSQNRQDILYALRRLLADAISGDLKELDGSIALIQELLRKHQEKEPFSELPENISIQLAAIEAIQTEKQHQVSQLALSLSNLYASNRKELLKQSKLAIWSVVFGIVGVVIGLLSWLIK